MKILLIDDAYLTEVHNLRRKVNEAVKHPEPVITLDAPWDTEKLEFFEPNNVVYDRDEKLFRMWYCVSGQDPNEYWDRGRKVGYATSRDGIHWERPIQNMVEVRGSKQNNYITPEMLEIQYSIIIDPSDVPARRFKMIFQVDSEEQRWARHHMPLNLATSPDGIHWHRPVHVNPVIRGISDAGFELLYDPDRRKYQLYTRRVPNIPRDISLYESYDLVNWEDRGRILQGGDALDPVEMFNLQSLTPFFYEDFCLGLLNTHYTLPGAEPYEIFNPPPAEWADRKLGLVDIQLAHSRDCVQWSRPDDRSPIVPNGPAGSPDAGIILVPCANVVNGDTYIHYSAWPYGHNAYSQTNYLKEHDNDMRKAVSGMLAIMPEDHWVSLDAGSTEGWLLTKPYGTPSRLLVNADAKGGGIEAEIQTPYGKPVEGFTRADCIGISGNGKDQEIRWTSKTNPRDLNEKHRGGLCLKFFLRNAKLYSYTLVEPDPDRTIRAFWENARWNEAIMHRRDNWDGRSNEPAGGLPQRPGTQHLSGTRFGPNPRAKAKWS